ncbi:hypothetical protein K8I85_18000 [bacterium]|nr:hypothetical protein [bacterium]
MIRLALVLTALWAVTFAPALCATGVLAHECPCADERACEHESDCDTDPCSDLLLRRDEARHDVDPSPDALTDAWLPPAFDMPVTPVPSSGPPPLPAPPRLRPAAEFPLLS